MGKLKILVTGKDGQLGYALQELSGNQFEFTWKFTDRSELDITDSIKTQSVLKQFQPDWIINSAAYTDVDGAESNEEIAYKVNAVGPHILAKSAKEIGAKLVHISTDYVFDGTKKEPYSENDTPNPLQVYGKSKLKGELFIQDTSITGFIIRTSWVYGNHGKNFVNTILKLAKEKNEIQVVDDQFGSPTYVKDLAKVVIELLSKRQINEMDLYHFSNHGVISWFDFAKCIKQLMNLDLKIQRINSCDYYKSNFRPTYSVLDLKKINSVYKNIEHYKKSLKICLRKK
mgnify:FL=1